MIHVKSCNKNTPKKRSKSKYLKPEENEKSRKREQYAVNEAGENVPPIFRFNKKRGIGSRFIIHRLSV